MSSDQEPAADPVAQAVKCQNNEYTFPFTDLLPDFWRYMVPGDNHHSPRRPISSLFTRLIQSLEIRFQEEVHALVASHPTLNGPKASIPQAPTGQSDKQPRFPRTPKLFPSFHAKMPPRHESFGGQRRPVLRFYLPDRSLVLCRLAFSLAA